jgi:catechol 2,3-dioxygenase-like lactoylglutathione lyase family enzyme
VDWKLEVVTVPVADVDRAKRFYEEQLGFDVDLDTRVGGGARLVQLTPPGSGCSIHLNTAIADMAPGSLRGVVIVVPDVEAAQVELAGRGVDASPVRHMGPDGAWADGHGGDWNAFVFFSDPDGNAWTLQERPPSA